MPYVWQSLLTDKFFKTRRCPLFSGFTVKKMLPGNLQLYIINTILLLLFSHSCWFNYKKSLLWVSEHALLSEAYSEPAKCKENYGICWQILCREPKFQVKLRIKQSLDLPSISPKHYLHDNNNHLGKISC